MLCFCKVRRIDFATNRPASRFGATLNADEFRTNSSQVGRIRFIFGAWAAVSIPSFSPVHPLAAMHHKPELHNKAPSTRLASWVRPQNFWQIDAREK